MARRRKKASAIESEVVMTEETPDATESSKSESEGSTEQTSTDIGVEATGEVLGGEDVSETTGDSEGTESAVAVEPTVEVVAEPEVKVEPKPKKVKKEVFKAAPKKAPVVEASSAPKPSSTSSYEKKVNGKTVQINSAWTS